MDGFYSPSEISTSRITLGLVPKCGACGLFKNCQSPKMKVSGRGEYAAMIVGEAPEWTDDEQGKLFVGKAGKLLRNELSQVGLSLDKDFRSTNALICRPPKSLVADGKMIEYCRPNLMNAIKEYKPKHILLFGRRAVASLIGYLWDSDVGTMQRWTGWKIPSQELNAWIYPNFHPSFVLRQEKDRMLARAFQEGIEDAAEHLMHNGRPWKEVPNYESKVEVIIDQEHAARRIEAITKSSKAAAFDFETNMLKPDSDRGKIVCCAISNGKETVAYPWHGKTVQATKQFLLSPVKKIGYNLKFEERWCLAKLGISVRNWIHDGMIVAHALDYRKEITGLKFQAFVLLGQKRYDANVEPYLTGQKGPDRGQNTENQIDRVAIRDLLLYCGMDALLEYEVAKIQKKVVDGN